MYARYPMNKCGCVTLRVVAVCTVFLCLNTWIAHPVALAQTKVGQPGIRFRDIGPQAGLTTQPPSSAIRRHLVETMGGGGIALFDCDNDGRLDIAVVNDSTIDHCLKGGDLMVTLYHQDSTEQDSVLKNLPRMWPSSGPLVGSGCTYQAVGIKEVHDDVWLVSFLGGASRLCKLLLKVCIV